MTVPKYRIGDLVSYRRYNELFKYEITRIIIFQHRKSIMYELYPLVGGSGPPCYAEESGLQP